MKTTTKLLRALFLTLCTLAASGWVEAATISWVVQISPVGGGTVDWKTSSPAAEGTLTKTGTLKFNSGANVDLTFKSANGYQLASLTKNGQQWSNYLDANKHFQFGPVSAPHVIVALFALINPTGQFKFSPDGKAPSVVDVTGNYSGITTKSHRDYNVDVAMDESGKLSAMGTVSGIVPKAGGAIQGSVGSVKTISNQPNAQLTGSFNGTKDGVAATGSGKLAGPVTLQSVGGGESKITGVGSGTAKVGASTVNLKTTTTNFPVTASQAANLSKDWDLAMVIREVTDAKTSKKTLMASSTLSLPSGDKTFFKEKAMVFNPKGSSIAFSSGVKLDALGNPIIDPKTKKQVIDTKSSVSLTGLILSGTQGQWFVSGGSVSYSFLGQNGKGTAIDFTGTEVTLFNNWNTGGVGNTPTAATTFTLNQPSLITYLNSYHWNFGQGTTAPGRLSLRHQDGTVYGPWQAVGRPGQGGVKNALWECQPLTLIKAGTYSVVDSDLATWSQNGTSGGRGFSEVRGKQ